MLFLHKIFKLEKCKNLLHFIHLIVPLPKGTQVSLAKVRLSE